MLKKISKRIKNNLVCKLKNSWVLNSLVVEVKHWNFHKYPNGLSKIKYQSIV